MAFHSLHWDLQLPGYLTQGDDIYSTKASIPSVIITQSLIIVSTYVTIVPEKITVTESYVTSYAYNTYAPTYSTVYHQYHSIVSPRRHNKGASHGRRVKIMSTNNQKSVTMLVNYSNSTVKSTTTSPLDGFRMSTEPAFSVYIRVKYYTLYPVNGYAEIIMEDYPPFDDKRHLTSSLTPSIKNTTSYLSVQNFTHNYTATTLSDVATGASAIFYISTPYPTEIIIISLSVTSFAILILGKNLVIKENLFYCTSLQVAVLLPFTLFTRA